MYALLNLFRPVALARPEISLRPDTTERTWACGDPTAIEHGPYPHENSDVVPWQTLQDSPSVEVFSRA